MFSVYSMAIQKVVNNLATMQMQLVIERDAEQI